MRVQLRILAVSTLTTLVLASTSGHAKTITKKFLQLAQRQHD